MNLYLCIVLTYKISEKVIILVNNLTNEKDE